MIRIQAIVTALILAVGLFCGMSCGTRIPTGKVAESEQKKPENTAPSLPAKSEPKSEPKPEPATDAEFDPANFRGHWEWMEPARKGEVQRQFVLAIDYQGKFITGIYSVNDFIDGEWQGEDGNQTPFAGTYAGSEMTVEFDPMNVHPGYEENVEYRAPDDGREPSFARMVVRGDKMEWTLTGGDPIEGIPNRVVLKRDRP